MANKWTQGRGVTKFGGTDYSTQVTAVRFRHVRQQADIPQTFGSDTADVEYGAVASREITVDFLNPTAASSLHKVLADAFEDDGEVTFDVLLNNASAGTNNLRHTGTMIVSALDTGGTVGEVRSQSRTYRIVPSSYATTTT